MKRWPFLLILAVLIAGVASSSIHNIPRIAEARMPMVILAGSGDVGGSPPSAVVSIDVEENDFTDYTSTSDADGDMTTTVAAAMNGTSYGISLLIDDANAMYGQIDLSGQDFTTNGKFKMSFYLDPNTLTMGSEDKFAIIRSEYTGDPYNFLWLYLEYNTGTGYSFITEPTVDTGGLTGHEETISDGPHLIEVEMTRAATNVSSDGSIVLKVDGGTANTWSSIDNYDTLAIIDWMRLGAISSIDAGTSGTFYLDGIEYYDDF
jgi:hypothetical protein